MLTRNTKFHFDNVYQEHPVRYGCLKLTQIGDIFSRAEFEVVDHLQYCYEISLIVAGSGVFTDGAKRYTVRSGDLFFSQKDRMHSIRTHDHNPLRFYYLGFDFDRSHPDYPSFSEIETYLSKLEIPLIIDRFNLQAIFNQVFTEIVQQGAMKETIIKTCLEQILIHTYRNFARHLAPNIDSGLDLRLKSDIAYTIINYIDNNILNIRKLTDITGYIGYSYSYASQLFSNIMGISIGQYFQQARFQKSVEFLKTGSSITQIAQILGFDSVHSFSRSFKKHFGVSPRHYILDGSASSGASEESDDLDEED